MDKQKLTKLIVHYLLTLILTCGVGLKLVEFSNQPITNVNLIDGSKVNIPQITACLTKPIANISNVDQKFSFNHNLKVIPFELIKTNQTDGLNCYRIRFLRILKCNHKLHMYLNEKVLIVISGHERVRSNHKPFQPLELMGNSNNTRGNYVQEHRFTTIDCSWWPNFACQRVDHGRWFVIDRKDDVELDSFTFWDKTQESRFGFTEFIQFRSPVIHFETRPLLNWRSKLLILIQLIVCLTGITVNRLLTSIKHQINWSNKSKRLIVIVGRLVIIVIFVSYVYLTMAEFADADAYRSLTFSIDRSTSKEFQLTFCAGISFNYVFRQFCKQIVSISNVSNCHHYYQNMRLIDYYLFANYYSDLAELPSEWILGRDRVFYRDRRICFTFDRRSSDHILLRSSYEPFTIGPSIHRYTNSCLYTHWTNQPLIENPQCFRPNWHRSQIMVVQRKGYSQTRNCLHYKMIDYESQFDCINQCIIYRHEQLAIGSTPDHVAYELSSKKKPSLWTLPLNQTKSDVIEDHCKSKCPLPDCDQIIVKDARPMFLSTAKYQFPSYTEMHRVSFQPWISFVEVFHHILVGLHICFSFDFRCLLIRCYNHVSQMSSQFGLDLLGRTTRRPQSSSQELLRFAGITLMLLTAILHTVLVLLLSPKATFNRISVRDEKGFNHVPETMVSFELTNALYPHQFDDMVLSQLQGKVHVHALNHQFVSNQSEIESGENVWLHSIRALSKAILFVRYLNHLNWTQYHQQPRPFLQIENFIPVDYYSLLEPGAQLQLNVVWPGKSFDYLVWKVNRADRFACRHYQINRLEQLVLRLQELFYIHYDDLNAGLPMYSYLVGDSVEANFDQHRFTYETYLKLIKSPDYQLPDCSNIYYLPHMIDKSYSNRFELRLNDLVIEQKFEPAIHWQLVVWFLITSICVYSGLNFNSVIGQFSDFLVQCFISFGRWIRLNPTQLKY